MNAKISEEIHNNPQPQPTEPASSGLLLPADHPHPVPAQPRVGTKPDSLALARRLLAPALHNRKFRAQSFVAKLNDDQRLQLFNWLQQDTIPQVRARVAAPAPEGFGLQVHNTTLVRLRNLVRNTELNQWIATAMDAASDILAADTSVDVTPVRESMSLLLHAHAMNYISQQADPISIDRLITSIARLEKLKTPPSRVRESRPVTSHHRVDLSIKTQPAAPGHITVEAIPAEPPQLADASQ